MTTSSKTLRFVSGLLLSIGGVFSAHAQVTNTMTNIVTVADACDIAAIGIDFGIVTAGNTTIVGFVPTTSGNTPGNPAAGNSASGHPDFGADGSGDTNPDDDLTLNVGGGAVQGLVDTLLSTVVGTAPGVYVACTVTPTVTLETEGGAPLSLVDGANNFTGVMTWRSGGGGSGTDTIGYSLTLTGATDTPATITTTIAGFNVKTFPVTAASITPGTFATGYYSDYAVATVNF